MIGITNNCDWTEPGSSKQIDIDAATRANEWWLAWFTDPIWLGHYPASMVAKLGDRHPTFTPQEQAKLRGSADFFGLNHYGSRFARDPGPRPLNYGKAHGNASSYWGDFEADIYHTEEMPVAASTWLFSVCAVRPKGHHHHNPCCVCAMRLTDRCCVSAVQVPWGLRKLLKWIDTRYHHPTIYVTENGWSTPGDEHWSKGVQDDGRVLFYHNYTSEMQVHSKQPSSIAKRTQLLSLTPPLHCACTALHQ